MHISPTNTSLFLYGSYSHDLNMSLVGSCLYTCHRNHHKHFFYVTINSSSEINTFFCSEYFRQGQLCGSCVTSYAPPVYSVSTVPLATGPSTLQSLFSQSLLSLSLSSCLDSVLPSKTQWIHPLRTNSHVSS